MSYDELLKAFGEKMGGSVDMTPDDAGAVALDVDGMALTILGLEEIGQVVLTGVIGEPPPEDRMERLYKAMLMANHNFAGTFGATLSVNPDDGKVSLCKTLPLALSDGESFFAEVEHFANTLETWIKLVADFRGAEIGDGAAGAPSNEAPGGGGFGDMGGFMQV